MDVEGKIRKFTWRIENFSSLKDKFLYSEKFIVDGFKWQIHINTLANSSTSLHFRLAHPDYKTHERSRFAQLGLAVIDQNERRSSSITYQSKYLKVSEHVYDTTSIWLYLDAFYDPHRGYLVNDACVVEAYISSDRTRNLISHKLIVESVSDGHKLKANNPVNAKPVEFTTSSSTPSSSKNVDIESEEPTEEDMKTFFTSIESEFLSSNIVYSQEEAREAVAKLDEALTPNKFYDFGKFLPLKKAFKILSAGTTLTVEQKNELSAMENRLKEIADRAAKSLQDENLLNAKESNKLTISGNIKCNLIRFREVGSEVEQVNEKLALLHQKLAALHEQVEETQKKKENMLNEQKEIFRSSKKMKMELVTLQKECAEYETNAKVAEEEEKTVQAELKRMKKFISSIKGKI